MASKEASIVYETAKDHRYIAVNGVYGGPSPGGSTVVAHLLVGHMSIPSSVTHPMDENGVVDMSQEHRIARGDVTRSVQATLVLTPEHAKTIGAWLVANGEQLLNVRKDRDDNAGDTGENE